MKNLEQFLRQLEDLEWSPAGHMEEAVLPLLAEMGRERRLLIEAVSSWTAKNLEKRQLRCHETATHLKWFVHYNNEIGFKLD